MSDLRYELRDEIGRGEWTRVARARVSFAEGSATASASEAAGKIGKSGRMVAFKEPLERFRTQPREMERVFAAAEMQKALEHPGLAAVFDVDPRRGGIVTELLEGNVRRFLVESGLDSNRVRWAARQILDVLTYLHGMDRLHGRIHPENVLFDREGRLKLSDPLLTTFGAPISRVRLLARYAAPEALDPTFGDYGPEADLYSTGLVLLEMLAGPRFAGCFPDLDADKAEGDPTVWAGWQASHTLVLPPVRSLLPKADEDLAHVLDQLLQKSVDQRYRSAQAALLDLKTGPKAWLIGWAPENFQTFVASTEDDPFILGTGGAKASPLSDELLQSPDLEPLPNFDDLHTIQAVTDAPVWDADNASASAIVSGSVRDIPILEMVDDEDDEEFSDDQPLSVDVSGDAVLVSKSGSGWAPVLTDEESADLEELARPAESSSASDTSTGMELVSDDQLESGFELTDEPEVGESGSASASAIVGTPGIAAAETLILPSKAARQAGPLVVRKERGVIRESFPWVLAVTVFLGLAVVYPLWMMWKSGTWNRGHDGTHVAISSEPASARILVDGREVLPGPEGLAFAPGEHELVWKSENFTQARALIAVEPDGTIRLREQSPSSEVTLGRDSQGRPNLAAKLGRSAVGVKIVAEIDGSPWVPTAAQGGFPVKVNDRPLSSDGILNIPLGQSVRLDVVGPDFQGWSGSIATDASGALAGTGVKVDASTNPPTVRLPLQRLGVSLTWAQSVADASILLDGKPVKADDPALKLAVGEHNLRIQRPGYQAIEGSLNVNARGEVTVGGNARGIVLDARSNQAPAVRLDWTPLLRRVEIRSRPAGLAVTWDGAPVAGVTPVTVNATTGAHELAIQSPAFQPWKQSVKVTADGNMATDAKPFAVSATLTPLPEYTNALGMPLVLIPAGAAEVGAPASLGDAAPADERPRRRVVIDEPFFLGKWEVTQKQYQAVMNQNPSRFASKEKENTRGDHPVEQVSYSDALAFCDALCKKEGLPPGSYRLPSEWEWEYAAAPGLPEHAENDTVLERWAWFRPNAMRTTHPVGQKAPNARGLYDVLGNVREWCLDWYDPSAYEKTPQSVAGTSPPLSAVAPPGGNLNDGERVHRGGDWLDGKAEVRPARRGHAPPDTRESLIGFRVLRVIYPPAPATASATAASSGRNNGGQQP